MTKDGQRRIFVSGSSLDIPRASNVFDVIRGIPGVLLSWDWIAAIKKNRGRTNRNLPKEVRRYLAKEALDKAVEADLFWLLCPGPRTPSNGVWVELGAFATAHRKDPKPILISGGDPEATIFTEVGRVFEHDWEAAGWIRTRWGQPHLLSQTDLVGLGSGTPHGGF